MKKVYFTFIFICFTLLLTACGKRLDKNDLENIEIVHILADRSYMENLSQVETEADVIVEAIAIEDLGQETSSYYDYSFNKELPLGGFTKWNMEATKVYKGNLSEKENVTVLQNYCIWTYDDGTKQMISSSNLKPINKNQKYLLFLKYDDTIKGYWLVCDYEGLYEIPDKSIKEKIAKKTVTMSDLPVYSSNDMHYLISIYNEVAEKYFK